MPIKTTKVAIDDYVKTGKGIQAFEQLYCAYQIRYSPYAKRYTINIYGKKFTGIGIGGLLKAMTEVAEMGLRIDNG